MKEIRNKSFAKMADACYLAYRGVSQSDIVKLLSTTDATLNRWRELPVYQHLMALYMYSDMSIDKKLDLEQLAGISESKGSKIDADGIPYTEEE